MSSFGEEVFVLAINETLKQWKSFQLSVENGMGGEHTNEKLIWMSTVIKDFFKDNNDLMCEEVMAFVAQIIDNEFDTIIEDGSLEMFASSLCKYYQLCSSGREEEVTKKLDQINRLNNCNNSSDSSLKSNDQLVVEKRMESLNIEDKHENKEQTINNIENESETSEEKWTLVQRKHKK